MSRKPAVADRAATGASTQTRVREQKSILPPCAYKPQSTMHTEITDFSLQPVRNYLSNGRDFSLTLTWLAESGRVDSATSGPFGGHIIPPHLKLELTAQERQPDARPTRSKNPSNISAG